MKKVVRMLGLCALMALAFSACKKNDDTNKVTFKATICQPKDDSRTHIENINAFGYKGLFWNAGNQIEVIKTNSGEDERFVAESTMIDGQNATFEGTGAFLSDIYTPGAYTAFYPYRIADSYDGGDYFWTWIYPYQNFAWESFADNIYPMYGVNSLDDAGEPVFNFHSNAGVLRLQFKLDLPTYGEDAEMPVVQIQVYDKVGNAVAGPMKYDRFGNYLGLEAHPGAYISDLSNHVTLNMPDGGVKLVSTRWTDFYIVLPEGALSDGFYVVVALWTGQLLQYEGAAGHPIQAETITSMPQLNIIY